MILLSLLALISLAAGIRTRQMKPMWSVLFFLLAAGVFLSWLAEYSWGETLSFFTSDEEIYHSTGQIFNWSDFFSDRGLWNFLNYWLIQLDIPTSGYALKIINVFFLYLLLLLLSKVYLEGAIFKLAVILLPYIFIVSIHNLRDTLLLLLTTASLYCLTEKRKKVMAGLAALSLLFFLRPIFAGIVMVLISGVLFIQLFKKSTLKMRLRVLAILAVCGLAVGPVAYEKLDLMYRRTSENIKGGGVRLERTIEQGYATGNRARDLAVACARYAFSPLPTSILQRLAAGGSEEWGRVDDFVRLWSQTGYFFLLVILLLRWKTALFVIKRMTHAQKVVLLSLFMYMPIYSLHLYGACHQRLKLPFQLSILIVVALVIRKKKRQLNEDVVSCRERIAEVHGGRQKGENFTDSSRDTPEANTRQSPLLGNIRSDA